MRRTDAAWLSGQGLLFTLAFVVIPGTGGGFGRIAVPAARLIGSAIFLLGAVLGVLSAVRMGRQLAPQPSPVRHGSLIDTGPYAVVRHPIYTAVLLMIAGSVVRVLSLAGLLVTVVSAVFFDRKIAYEEALLADAYPQYPAYQRRVRWKLLPGVR